MKDSGKTYKGEIRAAKTSPNIKLSLQLEMLYPTQFYAATLRLMNFTN